MDLVIRISSRDVLKLSAMFPPEEYYCPPPEVLTQEVITGGQFNFLHNESGLKIDLIVIKENPHSIEEFSRRKKMPFGDNLEVFVATPEDVIIKKLLYHRDGGSEKHLTDIKGILANTKTDDPYIEKWVSKMGLKDLWKKVDR